MTGRAVGAAGESICHAKSQRAVFRVSVRISWHTHTLENSGS